MAPGEVMPAAVKMLGTGAGAFYDLPNQTIWRTLVRMYNERVVIEIAVVGQRLKDAGELDAVGGYAALSRLIEMTPSAASFGYFLDVLLDKSRRRELIRLASDARTLAEDSSRDPAALTRDFATVAENLTTRNGHAAPVFSTVTIDEILDYKPDPRSWLIGADMICRGEFSVLAGLPEAGKSMLGNTAAVAGAEGVGTWQGYDIRRRFKTLVLQSEGSMRRMQRELGKADRERLRDHVQFTPPTHLQFANPEFRRGLRQKFEDWPFDLLIIDNWSDCVLDDKFSDYQTGLDNIRAALPDGDDMPAVLIIAHLSKAVIKMDRPMSGRSLMAHVSGSFRLGQKARTVFTLVRAWPDEADDATVIFDCAKASNDTPLPPSAWLRQPLRFAPVADFDFPGWFNPPENARRGGPSAEQMDTLFQGGRRILRRSAAAKELESLGFSRASVYRYLDTEKGPFKDNLAEKDGMLTWTPN